MLEYVPIGEFDIIYLDGEPEIARSNFGAIMDLETEYIDVAASKVQQGTVLVKAMWLYLGRSEPLDEWAKKVHRIEPRPNGTRTDPSPPAAGGE
jgi:hypothetical protein